MLASCAIVGCGSKGEEQASQTGNSSQFVTDSLTQNVDLPLIAGSDANSDGIRDDVEAVVLANTSAADPAGRTIRAFASALQAALLKAPYSESIAEAANKYVLTIRCLVQVYGADEADRVVSVIKDATVNSESRLRAFLDFNIRAGSVDLDISGSLACS